MTTHVQDFLAQARVVPRDLRPRGLIQTALRKYETARDRKKAAFNDWQSARQAAAETKWDAINHLDTYLTEFADKMEARGTQIHWAGNAAEAREIIGAWRADYNQRRPHSALGYRTPAEFAAAWRARHAGHARQEAHT